MTALSHDQRQHNATVYTAIARLMAVVLILIFTGDCLARAGQTMLVSARQAQTTFLAAALQAEVFTPGLVKFEAYDLSDRDVEDLSVSVLTSHPSFPDNPADVRYIRSLDTTFAYPDRTHDQYGSRMTALFVAPVTGNYIFYLRSDDASELWFNSNGPSPAGRTKIVEQTECCNLFSERASAPQALVGGQYYYIETLHREGPEYDYCQVAVKLESDPTDPDTLLPVSHHYLGIMAESDGVSISALPAHNAVALLPSSGYPPLLLAEDLNGNDGAFHVESDNPQGPWTYSPDRGAWFADGHNECLGAEVSALNVGPITIQQADELFLVFRHRWSFQYDGVSYDGGQVRTSVNGGAYQPVPAAYFQVNGYTGVVEGNNYLAGQQAFTGTSVGCQSGYYQTSVVSLGKHSPGTTLTVQFLAAWDDCISHDFPDWEITSVHISHTLARIDVAAAGYRPSIGTVPVAHSWQIDTGGGFVDYGSIEEVLWITPAASDDRTRFRALLSIPGTSMFSEPVTLRLTREPVCRLGGPYVAECMEDEPGLAVQLSSAGSSDPDGDPLSYFWESDCEGVVFDDPTSPMPVAYFVEGMTARPSCNITLHLSDDAGASDSCTVAVDTSQSMVAPAVTVNGNDQTLTCSASSPNQYVELGATALDCCNHPIEAGASTAADTRQKGLQTVTYTATDIFGNVSTAERAVLVEEPPAQLIDVPGDLVTECRAVGGTPKSDPTIANYLATPQAYDGCDADESVMDDGPGLLPVGTTRVTWTLWDGGPTGQTASANIIVQDTTDPVVNCAPLSVEAGSDGFAVLPDFTEGLDASDACTAREALTITQDPPPGTSLGLGTHDITFTVTDAAATPRSATCTTQLEVTGVAGDAPGGCGTPACGGNAMLSLSATMLGLAGLKRRRFRV